MIDAFSLEGVNKNRATMQAAKLDFLNRAHLRIKLADHAVGGGRRDVAQRARRVVVDQWPELLEQRPEVTTEEYVARTAEALKVGSGRAGQRKLPLLWADDRCATQDRMHTILDIPSLGPYFFHPPDLDSAIALKLYQSVPVSVYRKFLVARVRLRPKGCKAKKRS